MRRNYLITGGAGFIGGAVVRHLIAETEHNVCVVDKLTYAGNLDSLAPIAGHPRYSFERIDICNEGALSRVFGAFRPDIVLHLAAESHVDRSIDGPAAFIETNIAGTFALLEVARAHWQSRGTAGRPFRFHHVSTDEVFGSLGPEGSFQESSPYRPNSPYAASKAASDHLVQAWQRTYGLPVIVSNCSNNYGPYHFPEKLIPLMILNALEGKPLPIYGRGDNVRDWLYVEDHARALVLIAEKGRTGDSYNIGAANERTNLAVVETICRLVDEIAPDRAIGPRKNLIRFVEDRPGHDQRYAIDARKLRDELGWAPRESFEMGLAKTVRWYIDNPAWWQRIRSGIYRGERLGTVA